MFKASHKDFSCLLNILDSIEKIQSYTRNHSKADDFYNDAISFDATMMNFVVIGEMAEKLSDEFTSNTHDMVDWLKIRGFRNIIAHNYFGIDAEEVWQIIQNHLPELKSEIQKIVE